MERIEGGGLRANRHRGRVIGSGLVMEKKEDYPLPASAMGPEIEERLSRSAK